MFKNSKEKSNNYISTEEVEKMYEFQKKAFDAKIAEQQNKIDELANYISARFGEDVSSSNSYFKRVQKNESDIAKIKDVFLSKDEKILDLNRALEEHIKNNEIYKKEIQDEFKETKQKIGKINYLGISGKFDKKLKEESSKIYDKIEQGIEGTATLIGSLDERLSQEIVIANENAENVSNLVATLDKKLSKEIEIFSEDLSNTNKELENATKSISGLEEKTENKLEGINAKVESCANSIDNLEKKVEVKIKVVKEKQKSAESLVNDLEKRIADELVNANKNIEKTANSVSELDDKILMENGATAKTFEKKLNKLDKKIFEKIETTSKDVQEAQNRTNKLEEDFTSKFVEVNESLQTNQNIINETQEKIQKEIEQIRQEGKESLEKLENTTNAKNTKLEDKIKQVKDSMKTTQKESKAIEANLKEKLEQIKQENNNLYTKFEADIAQKTDAKIQEVIANAENVKLEVTNLESKIKKDIQKAIKDIEKEKEKIKVELNEQIAKNNNENKTELVNISSAFDIVKGTMEMSIDKISKEVIKLKEETKTNLEKQNTSATNIEEIKKDYNKYVTKMNNELAKVSKAILNAQKKNLETSQNLQVKIKTYIDNKIEKVSNTQKVEELINNLNLSILEREKLQKIEMEELLNKKLKAIQKENERILNKKIEEITSKLIRNNAQYTKTRQNNITLIEEPPKKKKNMYELIDENQILKRSATSKNPLPRTKEGKSQILKFFYDEEE